MSDWQIGGGCPRDMGDNRMAYFIWMKKSEI